MLDPMFKSIVLNADKKDLCITNLVKHIKELKIDLPETNSIKQNYEKNKKTLRSIHMKKI